MLKASMQNAAAMLGAELHKDRQLRRAAPACRSQRWIGTPVRPPSKTTHECSLRAGDRISLLQRLRAFCLKAALLVLFVCAPAAAAGLRFGFEPERSLGVPGDGVVLTMRGEIEIGDAERFASFLQTHAEGFILHGRSVVFVIDGGDVLEALKIGEVLRDALVEAWVPEASRTRCVSACFFIFSQAVARRAVPESVGLHRPYFDPAALAKASPEAVRVHYESLARDLRARMAQLSVPADLTEKMLQLRSGEVYWLGAQDLERLGARQPWFEDFLAAHCERPQPGSATDELSQHCEEEFLRLHRRRYLERLTGEQP
jgi:hypothetical protein